MPAAVPTDARPGSVVEDPALLSLRDRAVAKLAATLADEWKSATRDLSRLELVSASADLTVKVIAAKAQSVHRFAPDGSEDVLIYVADAPDGARAIENIVAVALHEIGHTWCCRGPGTTDGHWSEQQVSPGLLGVDRFGLMNHPVNCLVVPTGFLSCPNKFSDRELRTMGFDQIPAAVPDPCVLQRDRILGQLDGLRTQLADLRSGIDSANARLEQIGAQVRAIEAQYPSKVLPPDVYARYTSLVNSYNALLRDTQSRTDTYNGMRDRYNALVVQRNALPC